jgi:hypothetical protein
VSVLTRKLRCYERANNVQRKFFANDPRTQAKHVAVVMFA